MRLIGRAIVLALGVVSAVWAFVRFDIAVPEAALRHVASDIAAGESFKSETLEGFEPKIEAAKNKLIVNPDALRSIAVIRLRQAELALAAGQSPSKAPAFDQAEAAARAALALAPTDAFLWYALAWITKNRAGINPDVERYLALSYKTGPHEGWIAAHRNGFAVAMMSVLPPLLQAAALSEFRDLVASNFIDDAAAVVTGPGWPIRQQLLEQVSAAPEAERAWLAHKIAGLGFDVRVPGVDRLPPRPWK